MLLDGASSWGVLICLTGAAAGITFAAAGKQARHELLVSASLALTPVPVIAAAFASALAIPHPMAIAIVLAACLAAGAGLVATLLSRAQPSAAGGGWRRDLLDGLLAGDGVFSLCWTLGLMNGFGPFRLGEQRSLIGAALAGVCLITALCLVTVLRAGRPWPRNVTVAMGLLLIVIADAILTLAVVKEKTGMWVAGPAAFIALGCIILGWGTRFPRPANASPGTWPLAPFGVFPAFLAVASICSAATIQAVRMHSLDLGIATTGIPLAILLGLRIALALSEARRSALQLTEREAEYWRMANLDPLTALSNRRRLWQALDERARRQAGGPSCTLLVIDLDGFKDINDLNGHDVGDEVLVEVGKRLQAALGPDDLAIRLGGDEFAALISASQDRAGRAAVRLLSALCRPYQVDGVTVHLGASIGYADSVTAKSPKELMRNADLALRLAKQRGKSRIEAFDVAYDKTLQRRLVIEHDLRGSGKRKELSLAYQPIVDLASGRIVGAEALLRWQHPLLGAISPDEFVQIAEEAGLIGELGAWVIEHTCRELAASYRRGRTLWMSANVSLRELRAPRYADRIAATLRRHGVPPSLLVLEMTESAAAQDIAQLSGVLQTLRALGVRIALDDFGAGYSSLGQLRRLPVDILKIDRELVAEPPRAPALQDAPLVDVIVTLGHRLGLQVIAEGVETAGQREVVESDGCQLCQGFYFAGPLSPGELDRLLQEQPAYAPV
ncbi:bifunctional diguanylate cyclase/phosphodiesterase [Rhizocola hellebori]|uniref:Bifunctional diguanylate cyclase/phosphodiesterase n=2 Tax=Rhizocola hellebori TaxID=1392758 RepID=A0A8J3Q2I6_9ACTN|nr:bifunctional diguanylate cyclase/phosphodiesterase [Rhizocola hellebori]